MFIKEAHMMIEQGLQQVGVFAHSDMHEQELDLNIKKWIWKTMDKDFPNPRPLKLTKPKLDKYLVLIEKEIELSVTQDIRGNYIATLPANYFHIIKVDAVVNYICGEKHIESGNLEEGETYLNLGGTILYNSISLPIRTKFKATSTKTYSLTQANVAAKVIKLKTVVSSCRLVEEEFSTRIIESGLTKPTHKSPIVTMADKKIIISVKDFYIDKIYISYLKKPDSPNIRFRRFDKDVDLILEKEYEVIQGTVTYNGVTYTAGTDFNFPSFPTVPANYRVTGTGIVRIKGEGDINLPYEVALNIVEKVVLDLSIMSENNQSKIQNLASTI